MSAKQNEVLEIGQLLSRSKGYMIFDAPGV
jgi:hypothetical protein